MVQAAVDALRALAQNQVDSKAMARKCAQKRQGQQDLKSRRCKVEQQLTAARKTRLDAYKDKAAGILSEEEFTYISADLRKEEERCQKELEQLAHLENHCNQTDAIEKKIRAFLQFDHLEKGQLQQLVRRVEVDAHKHITITFNFIEPGKEAD